MSQYNILITGTGGCGVGEGLYKSLENLDKYKIYTCNSSDNSLYLFDKPENSFIVPPANSNNYSSVLIDICKKNDIGIILPGSEHELVAFVNNREKFDAENILIFANSAEVINTFDNKWETFVKLNSLAVLTPDTTLDANDETFFNRNKFPLIVKPIHGNASKNVFVVNSQDELKSVCHYLSLKNVPFVIQEHIGSSSEEYTISVLSDFSGEYLGSIVLKRILAGGFSQFVECDEFLDLDKIAQEIASKVSSKGPLNIQCRIMDDKLYVFEINPRFSGTTPFRTLLGFNEADILISKELEGASNFNKQNIKFGSFGVRGFAEKIYSTAVKSEVKSYN